MQAAANLDVKSRMQYLKLELYAFLLYYANQFLNKLWKQEKNNWYTEGIFTVCPFSQRANTNTFTSQIH